MASWRNSAETTRPSVGSRQGLAGASRCLRVSGLSLRTRSAIHTFAPSGVPRAVLDEHTQLRSLGPMFEIVAEPARSESGV